MALETLSEEDWMKVKKGEEEIGYAWLESVEKWQAEAGAGSLPLPAGRSEV